MTREPITTQQEYDVWLDALAQQLPPATKRLIQAAGLDPVAIIDVLTGEGQSDIRHTSRIGILRYWARMLRKEWVEVK